MNRHQAQKQIRLALIFNGIAIPVSMIAPELGDAIGLKLAYLYMPWLFPGVLAAPGMLVVALLTAGLALNNRVAAVVLLVLFVISRFFVGVFTLGYLTPFSAVLWVFITLVWMYLFVVGIRGTFALHRAGHSQTGTPSANE
jgi:hypothetical protein